MAREFKRHMQISESWIAWPDDIPKLIAEGVEMLIFIDDFLGTGDQFKSFYKPHSAPSAAASVYTVYAPLAAHTFGIGNVQSEFSHVHTTSAELLTSTNALFDPPATVFNDSVNDAASALAFYLNLLADKNIDVTGDARHGYGHLELTYAFSHATPDNCLPILWWRDSDNWHPLFDR